MYLRSLAAVLVAALPLAGAPAATAADIFRPYDPALAGSPYDDPRYADIYRDRPPPPPPEYAEPPDDPYYGRDGPRLRLDERYRQVEPGLEPLGRWSRHRAWGGEYLEPLPHAPRFEELRPRRAAAPPGCVPRHEIRRELVRDGWSDLHDLEFGHEVAFVTARRPNGRLYRLEIERCAGDIVRATRIEADTDEYAWRRRERYPAY